MLTKQQVAEWALSNGFTRLDEDTFNYKYNDYSVSLVTRPRKTSTYVDGVKLGSAYYNHLSIESDVLRGVGLVSMFFNSVVKPSWFKHLDNPP